MKYWISYFYQLRFFPPDILPLSTALSDPSWYRKKEPAEDSRGVIIGLRFPELSPRQTCGCPCLKKNPGECKFLTSYLAYLRTLNFRGLLDKIEALSEYLRGQGKDISGACLMVYETPENPCSERGALMTWFKENGVELKEYERV